MRIGLLNVELCWTRVLIYGTVPTALLRDTKVMECTPNKSGLLDDQCGESDADCYKQQEITSPILDMPLLAAI